MFQYVDNVTYQLLTAYFPTGQIDPSGTGSGTLVGCASRRPDRVANGNSSKHDRNRWFNDDAFACPGQTGFASIATCTVGVSLLPIERYGTGSVSHLRGQGTVSLSSD